MLDLRKEAERRLREAAERRRDAKVAPPIIARDGGRFAHMGHRLDTPDERTVRHARIVDWGLPMKPDVRFIDGKRRVWDVKLECWVLDDARVAHVGPKKPPAPRTVYATPESADATLRRAVLAVVLEGGRPEEVTVVVRRR